MRTLKLLLSAAVVLLIAASANAGIILQVWFDDDGAGYEVDIGLSNQDGTGGEGTAGISILQFSWDYTGTPVGPAPSNSPAPGCNSAAPQYACDWGSPTMEWVGTRITNANGVGWFWSAEATGPSSANAIFTDIAHFTVLGGGPVTLKDVLAFDNNFNPITDVTVCGTNLGGVMCIPEPGTAALLGLGLTGLALSRRR